MIKTEKATTIWGFILLIMAAFFLATILFNMLPGTNPSGITGFFFSAGKMLYQVYGFSSSFNSSFLLCCRNQLFYRILV